MFSRSFFLPHAVNGLCFYPRAARMGESVREYLNLALSWTRGGREVLDLDCFIPIGDEAILSGRGDDPAMVYLRIVWRWLRDDEAIRSLTLAEAAQALRLSDARRIRFADGFVFFGRKAESLRLTGCARQAFGDAVELGLPAAVMETARVSGVRPDALPGTCEEMLR
jgi:hypothetical protein